MSYSILWIKELAWTLLSQRKIDIKLYWIPADVGIKLEVDRRAKEVITVGSDTQLLLRYTDLIKTFKAELKKGQLD